MKRFSILFFSNLLLSFGTALAQSQYPEECEVYLPDCIDKEVITESDVSSLMTAPYGQTKKTNTYWVAFSDRDNNIIYSQPKKSATTNKTLKFNERVIIARIKDNFALVYSDPKHETWPRRSDKAEWKGWIPMENLLLWSKVISSREGIAKKAVFCSNVDVQGKNEEEGYLYYSPVVNAKSVGRLKTDMHFFYVMKQIGTKFLLARHASMDTNSDDGLYGWVDNVSFVPWNQRTCLEPTWNPSDVEYFAQNNKKWKVYPKNGEMSGDAPAEGSFSKTQRKEKDSYSAEYKYRTMSRRNLRFPILEGSTDDIYYTSAFGTLGTGSFSSSSNQIDEDIEILTKNLEQRKVINMGIVIDGTSSMKQYFAAVKDAIKEGCKYFSEDETVNVAVLIYRDKEDGQYITECFPEAGGFTTPNNQNLNRWLDKAGEYGVKSVAPGETESVYFGIKTAIESFNFNPNQSNILLVVGDCGDNGKMQVNRDEIINALVSKKISLMGFQVRNENKDAYEIFNTQLTYIMQQAVQKRYDKEMSQMDSKNRVAQRVEAQRLSTDEGWDMVNVTGTNLYLSRHRKSAKFKVDMKPEQLTSAMEDAIGNWRESIEVLNKHIVDIIEGNDVFEGGFIPNDNPNAQPDMVLNSAIKALINDEARYKRLMQTNQLLSYQGKTKKKEGTRDLYKVVVFLPSGELKDLVQKLKPVYDVAITKDAKNRKAYYDAMMTLVNKLIAQGNASDMQYKEVLAKVFGLSNTSNELGGPSLHDITIPEKVSDKVFLGYVNKMVSSYNNLQKVLGSDYPFVLESVSTHDKYYWLPSEYLPL